MKDMISQWHCYDKMWNVMPWYTEPFLWALNSWRLEHQLVFEWGGGWSTLWFARRGAKVITMEYHADWVKMIQAEANAAEVAINLACSTDQEAYINAIMPYKGQVDIVTVDGSWRSECAVKALECVRPGGKIILDNAEHADKIQELLRHHEHHAYPQLDHPHWRTDYWVIRPRIDPNENTTVASVRKMERQGVPNGTLPDPSNGVTVVG